MGDLVSMVTAPIGLHANISNDDYHSGPGISSSDLKLALKCTSLYKAKLDGQLPRKETDAMRLGTAVHTLVLERDKFDEDIAVSPAFGRSKKDQAWKAEFLEENAGKTIITSDQHRKARAMAESLLRLEDVQVILESGEPEMSGYYRDADTGQLCKYRPDFRTDWCLFDVKTCQDLSAEAFSRTIHNFAYHVSAAHYLAGEISLRNAEHHQFIFGCVESTAPYLACTYSLDIEALELGRRMRAHALRGIKLGVDTGEWLQYNCGVTTTISLPRWAL